LQDAIVDLTAFADIIHESLERLKRDNLLGRAFNNEVRRHFTQGIHS